VLPLHQLEAAFNEAEYRRLTSPVSRWLEQRLIVECDGFAADGTRRAFEDDRARDRALVVDGWRVVRITWRQLTAEPETIAGQLATLLAQPAASSRPAHRSTARSCAA
jgi:hypothetical protein